MGVTLYKRGSLARRTSNGTITEPTFELIASGGNGCFLRQMYISLASAVASEWGLGRPAAIGVAPTSPVVVLSESNGQAEALLTKTTIAWTTTDPTVPVNFFRRVSFPATVGSNVLWDFENGIFIPKDGSVVLWNIAACGVADVSIVTHE